MILKHRDRELLRFDWSRYGDVCNVEVNSAESRFLPYRLRERVREGDEREVKYALDDWIAGRTAPLNRRNIREMLQNMGFKPRDPQYRKGLIEFCRGLSLNDVHWVTTDESSEKWKEVNLYDNPFSTAVATMAFSGDCREIRRNATTSPEYTTEGTLAKCWRRLGGEILLFKAGTGKGTDGFEGKNACGYEPYSEYFAAQVASALGFDHVDYGLARFKGRLCSTCRLFTGDRFGYLPAREVLTAEAAARDARFADIFFFDALVFNTDRHLGNFGFLVDNDTNEISGIAPIFDNGYGLFSQAICNPGKRNDEFHDLRVFVNRKSPALLDKWLAIPGGLTDHLIERLEFLRNFEFHQHPEFRLSADRLDMTLYFLRNRIEKIIQYREKADDYLKVCKTNGMIKPVGSRIRDALEADVKRREELKFTLRSFPRARKEGLAKLLKVSPSTITRDLKALQLSGEVRRIGSRKTGHWEVAEGGRK